MAKGITKTLSLVKGRRIRVTRTDNCGRPVFGDESTSVSKGFISVAYTAITNESDEISVPNAAGEICVFEPSETTLVGYSVEIVFCDVDPEVFSQITGNPVVRDAFGAAVGIDIDLDTDISAQGFALELWAGSASLDACETDGAQGSYGYLLLPFVKGGIVGDFTIENGAVSFTLTGGKTQKSNNWGFGPYADIQIDEDGNAGKMLKILPKTVPLRLLLVDVAPPTAYSGTRPLMDETAPAITAVTAVVTGASHEVPITVTPANIDTPVYYEFGDGTWDYIEAEEDGATEHTYPAGAGVYTVRATSNGVVKTTTVTIPA